MLMMRELHEPMALPSVHMCLADGALLTAGRIPI